MLTLVKLFHVNTRLLEHLKIEYLRYLDLMREREGLGRLKIALSEKVKKTRKRAPKVTLFIFRFFAALYSDQ